MMSDDNLRDIFVYNKFTNIYLITGMIEININPQVV